MKLYVLVDNTLPLGYQAVQAGHCVAEWLLSHKDQTWNNHTLIYLQVDDINLWINDLNIVYQLDITWFFEPDINSITSVAILSDGKLFKKLKLMGK